MSPIFPIASVDPRFRLYTATDGQIEFAVPFPWQNNIDIVVLRTDLDDVTTTLNEAEHYQLTGAGSPTGGTLTLTEGNEALEGEQFLLLGAVQLTRAGSIVAGGRFRSRSTDDDLDRMILIAQEVQRELGRALRTAYGVSGAEVDIGEDNVLPVWRNGRLEAGPVWGDELGIPGPGVPTGGSTGQWLVKVDGVDYNTAWQANSAANVAFSPAGALAALTVQNAIEELNAEKQPLDANLTAIALLTTTAFGRAVLALANAGVLATYAGVGTGDSPQFTAINLGHATDTTLTRTASGKIAVEGVGVILGALGSVDNVIVRTDGTGGLTAQATGIAIDDSNNVSGVGQLALSGAILNGATSGGTYNGNTVIATSDQFPSITWRSVTTAKVQHLADVNAGAYYVDAPGGYNIRDTINGGNTIMAFAAARMTAGVPLKLKSYTVATLPSGQAGDAAFASNGRALAGSTGAANLTVQGAGAGTGCLVVHNGTNWQVAGLNTTVAA